MPSIDHYLQPPATRAQVRALAKLAIKQELEIAALAQRVEQLQQYMESLTPPGPIILTVGQQGSNQPDFQQDWTQYQPDWAGADTKDDPPAPLQGGLT